jgi:hypothetical protein
MKSRRGFVWAKLDAPVCNTGQSSFSRQKRIEKTGS